MTERILKTKCKCTKCVCGCWENGPPGTRHEKAPTPLLQTLKMTENDISALFVLFLCLHVVVLHFLVIVCVLPNKKKSLQTTGFTGLMSCFVFMCLNTMSEKWLLLRNTIGCRSFLCVDINKPQFNCRCSFWTFRTCVVVYARPYKQWHCQCGSRCPVLQQYTLFLLQYTKTAWSLESGT